MYKENLARIFSAELDGVDARLVEVETDINVGLSSFTIVGLADKAVSEARERVSSALKNSNIKPPTRENRKVVVNLAPADIKKNGSQYDVPIALGYLVASKQISPFNSDTKMFIGELGLDGTVRRVSGILNICQMAKENGFTDIFIPYKNKREASLMRGLNIFPINNLNELISHLEQKELIGPIKNCEISSGVRQYDVDFSDVKGQASVKRALTIAAAGGHNIFMTGSPGAGKTMLVQALVSILPDMDSSEVMDVMRVWSAAGLAGNRKNISIRPFRSPHHSASLVSVVGGGQNPKPGEISLAHRGVLFLDEIPEFGRDVLESLRQPLESGFVVVSRARRTLVFPARVMLVAASNPCPCGYFNDPGHECVCSASEISRYQKKLSGPLLDRIDIQVWAEKVKSDDLHRIVKDGESSNDIRERVNVARQMQRDRFKQLGILARSNGELSSRDVNKSIKINSQARKLLENALDKGLVSTRGFFKTLKVARTIADLDDVAEIGENSAAEALSYRVRRESL